MTFDELVAEVYLKTNRPDLVDQTKSAVKAATLAAHNLDFFYKDIVAVQYVFNQLSYLPQIDTQQEPIRRWRALAYCRKNDPSLYPYQVNPLLAPPYVTQNGAQVWNQAMAELTIITPDWILDDWGYVKSDVCYQAGDTINIRSSSPVRMVLLGFYQFPNIDPDDYTSWIARDFPFVIIYEAASNILQTIGMTDAARKFDTPSDNRGPGLASAEKARLLLSNVTMKGY